MFANRRKNRPSSFSSFLRSNDGFCQPFITSKEAFNLALRPGKFESLVQHLIANMSMIVT